MKTKFAFIILVLNISTVFASYFIPSKLECVRVLEESFIHRGEMSYAQWVAKGLEDKGEKQISWINFWKNIRQHEGAKFVTAKKNLLDNCYNQSKVCLELLDTALSQLEDAHGAKGYALTLSEDSKDYFENMYKRNMKFLSYTESEMISSCIVSSVIQNDVSVTDVSINKFIIESHSLAPGNNKTRKAIQQSR